ncbi:DUF6503 family protein [Aquimarina sp. 2201CG5-10]|uniref:DUF6503 family protein n=1 Tax=Aquimarina callyspongiae TaxID=3098150 RepID=UPI002AB45031|nr:DUF6503 family protein [Aquimarina sp. 2201CG5-10]MDY8138539.1 DUF6503 family protein [Aquimarina sp. 2201CG5-10]
MNQHKVLKTPLVILVLIITLSGCKMADLRTSAVTNSTPNREPKAIALINKVIANQNLDVLSNSKTYSYKAIHNWKGIMALFNPFPKDNKLMEMKFRPNSFDAQFRYIKGRDSIKRGVQSFKYYTIDYDGNLQFKNKPSMTFTLPAVQYLFELPLRLKDAPILKYAGSTTFEDNLYDLVFATWESTEPNSEYDQYLLYISRKTGHLAFASYTVRDTYLPSPNNIYGSIRYENITENIDGIRYPSTLIIQINKLKKKSRWTQKISISDLKLNNFDASNLYPDKTLKFLGDSKN